MGFDDQVVGFDDRVVGFDDQVVGFHTVSYGFISFHMVFYWVLFTSLEFVHFWCYFYVPP